MQTNYKNRQMKKQTNLRFRVLMGRKKADQFMYDTYEEANDRLQTLSKIFNYTRMEILTINN